MSSSRDESTVPKGEPGSPGVLGEDPNRAEVDPAGQPVTPSLDEAPDGHTPHESTADQPESPPYDTRR